MNHWHLVIKEGEEKPRIVKVRHRSDAELEAQFESQIPDGLRQAFPFRDIKVVACWDHCLGK